MIILETLLLDLTTGIQSQSSHYDGDVFQEDVQRPSQITLDLNQSVQRQSLW